MKTNSRKTAFGLLLTALFFIITMLAYFCATIFSADTKINAYAEPETYNLRYFSVADGVTTEITDTLTNTDKTFTSGEALYIDEAETMLDGYVVTGYYSDEACLTVFDYYGGSYTVTADTSIYIAHKKFNFGTGNGTEENPYLIGTAEQLHTLLSGGTSWTSKTYFKLENDITLSESYFSSGICVTGITGCSTSCFTNTVFDGNGKTITTYGLYAVSHDTTVVGLFASVDSSEITDLTVNLINDVSFTVNSSNSTMAGIAVGFAEKSRLENVVVTGNAQTFTVTGNSTDIVLACGGLVGNLRGVALATTIVGCRVENLKISAKSVFFAMIGSISGVISTDKLINSTVYDVDLSVRDSDIVYEGGAVGMSNSACVINVGVYGTDISADNCGNGIIAGIVGLTNASVSNLHYYNCYFYGTVTGLSGAGITYLLTSSPQSVAVDSCYSNYVTDTVEGLTGFDGTAITADDVTDGTLKTALNGNLENADELLTALYGDLTLTAARWYPMPSVFYPQQIAAYEVKYNKNGATAGSVSDAEICFADNYITAPQGELLKTGYTFKGWTLDANGTGTVYGAATAITLSADTELYATWEINRYDIVWKNEDGTTLETDNGVAYGGTPSYDGKTPEKASSAQYSYTFNGWNEEISAVTGDRTYTATFASVVNKYTVTWIGADGSTLRIDVLEYGKTPSYSGKTPEKASSAQYSYTFNGWNEEISAVTGDKAYTATFASVVNKYTVTWISADGSTLKTDVLEYGKTPSFGGKTPEKAATDSYEFSFKGWSPEVTSVTGDVSYTAEFSETAVANFPWWIVILAAVAVVVTVVVIIIISVAVKRKTYVVTLIYDARQAPLTVRVRKNDFVVERARRVSLNITETKNVNGKLTVTRCKGKVGVLFFDPGHHSAVPFNYQPNGNITLFAIVARDY